MKKIITLSLALLVVTACKNEKKEDSISKDNNIETKKISIALSPKSNSTAKGFANFEEKDGKVYLAFKIKGLSEGQHAIHLHQEADCSSADGKSTGGHWNPTAQPHGKWGSDKGYHKGDIGNFEVGKDGVGRLEFSTNEWCIGCEDDTKNIIGKAVIVHQGTDDFTSQPSGAAGSRISCGGIIE